MAGAFVYADLAARNTAVGGQYAYLRDGWHPSIAFLYGWSMLLVIQTGGMAAVAVTFANYLVEMTGLTWSPALIASITLMALAAINLHRRQIRQRCPEPAHASEDRRHRHADLRRLLRSSAQRSRPQPKSATSAARSRPCSSLTAAGKPPASSPAK